MPSFLALHGKVPGTMAIADITDTDNPLWDDFRIRISPSILVFRDGALVSRVDGRRFLGITRSDLRKFEQTLTAH